MRIIPAIDIIDGKCVRLTQGDYGQKKIYHEDPLAVAAEFENAGLEFLHVVDLDGARSGKVVNWDVIETLSKNSGLVIDFGGGIKTDEEITRLFACGIKQVNIGSLAVRDKLKVAGWIEKYGNDRIILSADVKKEKIAISGWQEDSQISIYDFIQGFEASGLKYVTCTDIGTDGTLAGPNVDLYKRILVEFPFLKLVASGGVGKKEDLLALKEIKVDGAIVGKAIYEKKISLHSLKELSNPC
jgi:phosphoribosylformimino-5-aminoimidazole carboxamide ribotide isomerase